MGVIPTGPIRVIGDNPQPRHDERNRTVSHRRIVFHTARARLISAWQVRVADNSSAVAPARRKTGIDASLRRDVPPPKYEPVFPFASNLTST